MPGPETYTSRGRLERAITWVGRSERWLFENLPRPTVITPGGEGQRAALSRALQSECALCGNEVGLVTRISSDDRTIKKTTHLEGMLGGGRANLVTACVGTFLHLLRTFRRLYCPSAPFGLNRPQERWLVVRERVPRQVLLHFLSLHRLVRRLFLSFPGQEQELRVRSGTCCFARSPGVATNLDDRSMDRSLEGRCERTRR